jgi:ABC-type nickel/cobalt efflux system permease component RcnA
MTERQMSLGFMLLAAFIAAGLGALHALEPGHGKTIVAAYLVGSRGTARNAFQLGLIVTGSHTAGVYLLGAITMYAQKYILPERIYPVLAILSGVVIAGMGLYLVLQRFLPSAVAHSHSHSHGGIAHSHHHDGGHGHHHEPRGVSARQLLLLGITGGMIPCPAALVVLLTATALGRVGFGLFLIVCFSVGLATVLIVMGLMAIYAGRLIKHLPVEGPLIQRWLPMASAVMITVIGCVIAIRGLITSSILQGKI